MGKDHKGTNIVSGDKGDRFYLALIAENVFISFVGEVKNTEFRTVS